MSGKWAPIALIAALAAFGYLFTQNPGQVPFKIYPGSEVNTSLALILFLFFLAGFASAVLGSAFREGIRSIRFWTVEKSHRKNAEARKLLVEARGRGAHGDTRSARRLLKKAHRKSPAETAISMEMARAEIRDGKTGPAEKRLKGLIKTESTNPELLSLFLELYRKTGDHDGQLSTLTRWLELDPSHVPSLVALRDLYYSTGSVGQAARIQEKIAKSGGEGGRELLTKLRMEHARSLDADSARAMYEKIIEDKPFSPAYMELAGLLAAAGRTDNAVEALLKGFKTTGQLGLLMKAEEIRVEQGRTDDMLKTYKKLGRKSAGAIILRARLLLRSDRPKEALETVDRSDSGLTSTPLARLVRGEALYKLDRKEEAAAAFLGLNTDGPAPVGFVCSSCGRSTSGWTTPCPSCKAPDTMEMDVSTLRLGRAGG